MPSTSCSVPRSQVEPLSVKHQYKGKFTTDMTHLNLLTVPVGPDLPPHPVVVKKDTTSEVIYTYDVKWEYSPIKRGRPRQKTRPASCGEPKAPHLHTERQGGTRAALLPSPACRWASRWDLYLYMGDDQIHWFSIINSLAIVLLLTGIVAMIMMRTLRRGTLPTSASLPCQTPRACRPGRCGQTSTGITNRTRRTCRRRAAGSSCTPTSFGLPHSPSCCARAWALACSCSRWRGLPYSAQCWASYPPPTAAGCSPPPSCSSS